ncbi:efflux RND transporter periplasmic adaptor subunit [Methylotenera versatilis]|uniref:Efflux transporter, RND family, MFP subunit n=1 Tax=Methylotenera versatilis (strain 301) TaxID=666681 RepID=D7DIF6_METV0|nr:efflux RND transporter periplasmic adaptor subunit [Methylotenera versatilis]ADI29841.1 efflux transporter, RND family, MFP subunit [Methylotenera versatilis 301]
MRFTLYFTFFVLYCGQAMAVDLIKMTAIQQKNLDVKTVKLQAETNMSGQVYPAVVVVPVNQVHVVSSAYAGLVDQLQVTAGQSVKKGQVLAHIISPELISMQREYLQSNTQKRLARQSLDRDEALFKDGIIAEKRLQTSQNSHLETSAQMNERRQLLRLSGMGDGSINQLEKSGRYQNGIALVAPISGVVLEQMVSQGQRIDAVMPLLKIAQLSPLWVEVQVPLTNLKKNHIQKGALIAIKDLDVSGKVITVLPSMRTQDQTAIVRAEVRSGVDQLFPSQMVDVIISSTASASMSNFKVPTSALVSHQSRVMVFVQTDTGFEVREVKVVNTQGDITSISGDFNGTEKIVISGTAAIKASWQGMGGE